jgi:hypothetical protein
MTGTRNCVEPIDVETFKRDFDTARIPTSRLPNALKEFVLPNDSPVSTVLASNTNPSIACNSELHLRTRPSASHEGAAEAVKGAFLTYMVQVKLYSAKSTSDCGRV